MGNIWTNISSEKIKIAQKRPATTTNPVDDHPVRKRIRSTYDYVYRELFCKGEGSDLTVRCLDREWHLHRLYVKQSPFFVAMLDGAWKESTSDVIDLEITDTNVSVLALDTVFGSFYRDTLLLSEKTALEVLAAATWFHMDDIRLACSEFLERGLSRSNCVERFELAKQYNLPSLKQKTTRWLADSLFLMDESAEHFTFLRKIPLDLMQIVVATPDLVVLQVEEDVLMLLLKWVYLRNHPDCVVSSSSSLLQDAYTYFTSLASEHSNFFDTSEGAAYSPVFRSIRWEHVFNVHRTTQRIIRHRIIPKSWLCDILSRQWLRLLYAHEQTASSTRQIAPSLPESRMRTTLTARHMNDSAEATASSIPATPSLESLPEDVFWATSERYGRRMMTGDTTCSWRWTGYHFGLDVVVKYKRRTFSIIRFTETSSAEGAVSHAPVLPLLIALRVRSLAKPFSATTEVSTVTVSPTPSADLSDTVSSLRSVDGSTEKSEADENSGGSSGLVSTSGVLTLSLEENVIHDILRLPEKFAFPAVVSANILRYQPIGWDTKFPTDKGTYLGANSPLLCSSVVTENSGTP